MYSMARWKYKGQHRLWVMTKKWISRKIFLNKTSTSSIFIVVITSGTSYPAASTQFITLVVHTCHEQASSDFLKNTHTHTCTHVHTHTTSTRVYTHTHFPFKFCSYQTSPIYTTSNTYPVLSSSEFKDILHPTVTPKLHK